MAAESSRDPFGLFSDLAEDRSELDISFDLDDFGPIGKKIIKWYKIADEADFYFAFGSENKLRETHRKAVESVKQEAVPGTRVFVDDPEGDRSVDSANMLVARWYLAKHHADTSLDFKVRCVQDEVYARGARSESSTPQQGTSSGGCQAPLQQPNGDAGTGAIAPGRQHGFSQWTSAKQKGAKPFGEDKRGHMRFIFDVYCKLGEKGTRWMSAATPEARLRSPRISAQYTPLSA